MEHTFQILKKYFGFDTFRPLQERVIATILEGRSTLVLMPTGGGKSLCYQVPALVLDGTALVISPLIALMRDQVEGLKANGVDAAYINSSMTPAEEASMIRKCLAGELKLLYLSPEKALALRNTLLTGIQLSMIAIDEAHCISQWGHDFRPEYQQLRSLCQQFPGVPVIALTATAEKATRKDIISQLALRDPAVFIASFDRPNLHLQVRHGYKKAQKLKEIFAFLLKRPDDSGIIYCLTRNSTEEVAEALNKAGIKAASYHAGMDGAERSRVQDDFIKDNIKVICATIAFGMGIDKSNIRWVIHYNLPKSMENYYQEIGRAGRDGLASETLLYYNAGDLVTLNGFAAKSGQPEINREKIIRMQHYAEANVCRRKVLLSYFGEHYDKSCGNCDVCANPPKQTDGTVAAQKALSAAARTGEKAGTGMLIGILRGLRNAEIIERGYDAIKTHGAGREYSFIQWQGFMLQFLHLGLFEMAYDDNFALKITAAGREVLEGKRTVMLAETVVTETGQRTGADEQQVTNSVFVRLRQLRKLIADSEGLPPYLIFNDRTLKEMSISVPHTREELLNIQGVSESKLNKYGADFLQLLRTEKQPEKQTADAPLTVEMLTGWVDEMKKSGIRISAHVVTQILLGRATKAVPAEAEHLSFYGKLSARGGRKTVGPSIKQLFAELYSETENSGHSTVFDDEIYNHMDADFAQNLKAQIADIPQQRHSEGITNDYILNQRKQFPRAYEPWSAAESEMLKEAVVKTNDLNVLAEIFARNPGSLRSALKKMLSYEV